MCKQLAYLTGSTTLSFFHHEILLFDLEVFLNAKNILWRQGSVCLKRKLSHRIGMKTWFFQQHGKASKNHCKVYAGGDHTCFSFIFDSAVKEARNWMMAMFTTLYHNDWRWLDIMCVVGGFNIDDNMHFLCLENWHDLYSAIFMLHFVQYYAVCLRLDSAIRSKIWQSAMQLSQNPNEFS